MNRTFLVSLVMFGVIGLVAFNSAVTDAFSQEKLKTNQEANPALITTSQPDKISSIIQKIEKLEYETKSAEKRFDDFSKIFTYLGAFITIFVLILTIFSIYQGLQHHKDYLRERAFYEQHQQENLKREGNILSEQIDNMHKLGGVIDLVEKSFNLKFSQEQKMEDLYEDLKKNSEILDSIIEDGEKKYAEVARDILSLETVKAMKWPSLPDESLNMAEKAGNKFDSIILPVLQRQEKKEKYEFAKVLQLLGISAFYSNHIDYALVKLGQADSIYKEDTPDKHKYSRAYTKHFLGVIVKNWRIETSVKGSNIEEARQYLSEAYEIIKRDPDQFLIPVTLAEVLSYLEERQQEASELIDEIFARFNRIPKSGMDENQRSLFLRLHLLKGNLALKSGKINEACGLYEQAFNEDQSNAFAHLSFAHALSQDEAVKAREHWENGLKLLSMATKKREITTRVTALVWGIVAAHNLGNENNKDDYIKDLKSIEINIHGIGGRLPLFFSPLSKQLLNLSDIKNELLKYLNES
jgi:tetratricopeptide (TPR) repeat protein